MKILFHALTCYSILAQLSFTALLLIFHPRPFAFAYALAPNIDYYDGCVDTTQSQSDSALIKRVPSDTVEARQAEVAALIPIGPIIILTVFEVMLTVVIVSGDNPVRGNDAEFLVA